VASQSAAKLSVFGYGEVVDVFLQARRDGAAAKRFFKRLLRSYGGEPRKIVTDKLRSYGVAHRELMPETTHSTKQYENNRAEQSHEAVSNLFNLGRHKVGAQHYRDLTISAFTEWSSAVA
jgi:putative transposase